MNYFNPLPIIVQDIHFNPLPFMAGTTINPSPFMAASTINTASHFMNYFLTVPHGRDNFINLLSFIAENNYYPYSKSFSRLSWQLLHFKPFASYQYGRINHVLYARITINYCLTLCISWQELPITLCRNYIVTLCLSWLLRFTRVGSISEKPTNKSRMWPTTTVKMQRYMLYELPAEELKS